MSKTLVVIVAVLAVKLAWIFVLPVWAVATKLHWTTANRRMCMWNAINRKPSFGWNRFARA